MWCLQAHGIHKEGEVVHVPFPLESSESKCSIPQMLLHGSLQVGYTVEQKVLLKVKKSWVTDANRTRDPVVTDQMFYPLSYRDSHGKLSRWLSSCKLSVPTGHMT